MPMPPEDSMLYASHLKILELEKKLLDKEEEIKNVRWVFTIQYLSLIIYIYKEHKKIYNLMLYIYIKNVLENIIWLYM